MSKKYLVIHMHDIYPNEHLDLFQSKLQTRAAL